MQTKCKKTQSWNHVSIRQKLRDPCTHLSAGLLHKEVLFISRDIYISILVGNKYFLLNFIIFLDEKDKILAKIKKKPTYCVSQLNVFP